jgi:eukaryotic-like serine/threonine-protein kinase
VVIEHQRVEIALGNHCRVIRLLGAGDFGTVYEVHDKQLDRMIAVKALELINAKEARILAKLNHPHVVTIHDYRESNGLCLIIMESLQGGSLDVRLREGDLKPDVFCAIAIALADALIHVHALEVLHLDITPANTVFTASNLPKLIDMGLAMIFTDTSKVIWKGGTPNYSAPERRDGTKPPSPATDVYSIATCLYRGLAGRLPFGENSLPGLSEPPPALPGSVDPRIAGVVLKALAADPADRHQSAKQFALDLAAAARPAFGPTWASASGIKLHLDDKDVRAATFG